MPDYKQLCAELHAALDKHDLSFAEDELLDRSAAALRAALAEPMPPSLKEQALQALDEAVYMADDIPPEGICTEQADIIRRALESLPD